MVSKRVDLPSPNPPPIASTLPRRAFLAGSAATLGAGAAATAAVTSSQGAAAEDAVAFSYITVAACQMLDHFDLRRNMATILRFIREATENGVDVVLFPETCICG